MRRLSEREIRLRAAGVWDGPALKAIHVMDQRRLDAESRRIWELRRLRAARKARPEPARAHDWIRLRRYRRGVALWGRIVPVPFGRRGRGAQYMVHEGISGAAGDGLQLPLEHAAKSRRGALRVWLGSRVVRVSPDIVAERRRCWARVWRVFVRSLGPMALTWTGRMGGVERNGVCRGSAEFRAWLAARIREHRAGEMDPHANDTLGWRCWLWDGDALVSPHLRVRWETETLCATEWSDAGSVRGKCGIHARRMPRNWRMAGWPYTGYQEGYVEGEAIVTGVVERFGLAAIGETGWRAEQVVIRELLAADDEAWRALQMAYPGARVYCSSPACAGRKEVRHADR